ncbi:restriction endonuclease subunit S [Nitrosococcus oceani]|uniref:restriction endonuclease subunit S n=1 Tax=Nitrosococcus oceani TaxID=1229 RepID=UPI00068B9B8D|nr:restriction endonuclease subunit S [Nitrosococcus oceani]
MNHERHENHEKKEKLLVPRLRFPEFSEAGEWEDLRLDEISERITEKVGDRKLLTVSITAGVGFVSQAEKFSRDISGNQYKNYIVLREGEFAYNKGNSKKFPQGCIYKLTEFKEVAAPNAFLSFHVKSGYIASFYQGYFDNNAHGKQLQRFITSGARSDGLLNISPTDFFSIRFPTPKETEEQQKIADCLSSLDALIAAQAEKLDALKTHKKGLMQQLFPREGETVPRLRFPEFRDAREWKVKVLGKAAKNLDSKRVPITQKDRVEGHIPYVGASGIIDYVQDYIFDDDLLCISEDGANLVARTAPIAFSISGKTWVNNHVHVLKFKYYFTQVIVENYLNSISLENFLTGMAQPKLNRAKLDIIPIPLPELEEEQQKIADCLSSLDALIAAQAEKIGALKQHKKGLMQQLFPGPEAI